jgi:hypothetical protein
MPPYGAYSDVTGQIARDLNRHILCYPTMSQSELARRADFRYSGNRLSRLRATYRTASFQVMWIGAQGPLAPQHHRGLIKSKRAPLK